MSDSRIMGVGAKALTQPFNAKTASQAPPTGKGFMETLKESMDKVNEQQNVADRSVQDLSVGRAHTLHETMITVEQANISFKMMMAVRGKLVAAYHEVMRMQF
jgi:flagellar hook-basal body complex protein FliE